MILRQWKQVRKLLCFYSVFIATNSVTHKDKYTRKLDLTPQAEAKEDAEAPLAVVDVDAAVAEQRTAGDKGGTREILRTEIIDDGGTLSKDEVGEARAHR